MTDFTVVVFSLSRNKIQIFTLLLVLGFIFFNAHMNCNIKDKMLVKHLIKYFKIHQITVFTWLLESSCTLQVPVTVVSIVW